MVIAAFLTVVLLDLVWVSVDNSLLTRTVSRSEPAWECKVIKESVVSAVSIW